MGAEGQCMHDVESGPQQTQKPTREILIPESSISSAVHKLANKISGKHRTQFLRQPLTMLGVLKSAAMFTNDLSRFVQKNGVAVQIDYVQASSYGDGTESSGAPILTWTSPPETLTGKNILLVEDMIDTGTTLKALLEVLCQLEPSSLQVAVLLQKDTPQNQAITWPVPVHALFTIPDLWVDGYGIDSANKNRALADVWAVIRNRQEQQAWKKFRSELFTR